MKRINMSKTPLSREIPYFGVISKAMKQSNMQGKAKKKKSSRFTELKNDKPSLVSENLRELATNKLYMYEELGLTPNDVKILKERTESLEARIKKYESYE